MQYFWRQRTLARHLQRQALCGRAIHHAPGGLARGTAWHNTELRIKQCIKQQWMQRGLKAGSRHTWRLLLCFSTTMCGPGKTSYRPIHFVLHRDGRQ